MTRTLPRPGAVPLAIGAGTAGALLLYATNLVGISLAASVVFWRLRIHPSDQSAEEATPPATWWRSIMTG